MGRLPLVPKYFLRRTWNFQAFDFKHHSINAGLFQECPSFVTSSIIFDIYVANEGVNNKNKHLKHKKYIRVFKFHTIYDRNLSLSQNKFVLNQTLLP